MLNLSFSGVIRIVFMLMRGLPYTILKRRLILLGRGARIHNIIYMSGSGYIKIEDYAVLQCAAGVFEIGAGFSIGAYTQVRPVSLYKRSDTVDIRVGSGTTFGPFCYLGGKKLNIGKDNKIGMNVNILAENHDLVNNCIKTDGITIGDDNWFGSSVIVLDGSSIGNNNTIAAGTTITKKTQKTTNRTILNDIKNRYL